MGPHGPEESLGQMVWEGSGSSLKEAGSQKTLLAALLERMPHADGCLGNE
jgi:hypothetical protein